ncbi:MAG TPA: serine hydrolase [Methylomirabilota bacterium]|jgi:CubicO group peptidase (beta-lactamase class C family)
MKVTALFVVLPVVLASVVLAAPDEEKLGKQRGYPVGNAANWYYEESVRVGSFTHQAEIKGIFHGAPHKLPPASRPMPLPRATAEPDVRWNAKDARGLTLTDYLARQRIMGLLVVKDGVVQLERYQYDRKPSDRFTSQSMAKSITALAVGIAQHEGRIQSLDDPAERYAPALKGTVLGQTTLRNLLRMASGMKYEQTYDGRTGDTPRFGKAIAAVGIEAAIRTITDREVEQGTRFYYASPHTVVLAAVLRGATGMTLSKYLTARLWQAIGAEDSASWYADRTELEVALGNFNATLRDYARLGVVLANDGVRPDDPSGQPIVPREFLLEATDWKRGPAAFRPGNATPYWGYGYQFWLFPGERRRFAMVGVYGQSVFVDPELKLVMVQTGANATPEAGHTSLSADRDAFWRALVRLYGRW